MPTPSQRFSARTKGLASRGLATGEIEPQIAWEPSIYFLKASLAALMVGAVSFIVLLLIVSPEQTRRFLGPVFVIGVVLASWVLLRAGKVQLTLYVLSIGAWLATGVITTFTGGVRAPMIIAYPIIIVMVGWLLSTRLTVWLAGLTVMLNIVFVLAEANGFLPTPAPTHPAMHGLLQIIIFLLSALLVRYLVKAYLKRLTDLAESQAELALAQVVAKMGNWTYDVATDTLFSSARNSQIIGAQGEVTWTSEGFMAHIHPDDRTAVWADWLSLASGGVFDREHRIMVADDIRWIRQTAEMAFDSHGKPLRATGITHDVTDRKKADLALLASQAHLQEYSDSLERKVRERTRELDGLNRTLDQRVRTEIGKRKIQESVLIHQSRLAAMGEMIGAIAHQWRQPLNAISLVLQNMRLQHSHGALTDESMARMQDKAQLLVQRMSLTIDEFRELFKPGKKAEAFNLARAIRTTVDIMDGTLMGHGVSLTLECDEAIELVGVNGEFSQVMLNLLSNADDALQTRRPDAPRVTIRAQRRGDRIVVEVEDNAGGIDPSLLEQIFEPYFSTKNEHKGTGVGLYLSRMIVESNMHGRLTVLNVGEGARFTLDLPMLPAAN